MTQGQSPITPEKEKAFLGIFEMNLVVHKKSRFSYRYHHFDLNAGCGYNHEAGCNGSPLMFLEAAANQGVAQYYAHFVDHKKKAIEELLTRIDDQRCTIYQGDNREFVKAIPGLIRLARENPDMALGSVLCDPNGTNLPLDELIELSGLCPRLDLILNYSARAWKRVRGWKRACGTDYASPELYLAETLVLLRKKQWLIQDPLNDNHEWMIVVGRNYPMAGWSKMRFYDMDSPKGKEILRRSLSRRESTISLF